MITIATIFGSFCLLSAAFQFAFISLRRRPSTEVLDAEGQLIPVAEDSLPYLLEVAAVHKVAMQVTAVRAPHYN